MTRCPICRKRNWPWQRCVPSMYGFGHKVCIRARARVDFEIAFMKSIAVQVLGLIDRGALVTRSQVPNFKTRKETIQ